MSLTERIKEIFKKHGVTIFSVLTAVAVVIRVIVSTMKNGLDALGRGLGNALKAIGKKLGQILPVTIGSIASWLFKTAGEVIERWMNTIIYILGYLPQPAGENFRLKQCYEWI